jgi:hypothetical protein
MPASARTPSYCDRDTEGQQIERVSRITLLARGRHTCSKSIELRKLFISGSEGADPISTAPHEGQPPVGLCRPSWAADRGFGLAPGD